MRNLVALIVGIALSTFLMAETLTLDSLADLRWKHRIVLVDEASEQTVRELQARRAGIDERQILWFCVVNDDIRTNYDGALEEGFLAHLRADYFERAGSPVLLIGKDGGIKSENPNLDIDDYFIQIDGMPMRQAERARSRPD